MSSASHRVSTSQDRHRIAGVLATQQRQHRRRGNAAWRPIAEIGHQAGLRGAAIWREVQRAEQEGLVAVDIRNSGPFVSLSELGAKLFRLDLHEPDDFRDPDDEPGAASTGEDGSVPGDPGGEGAPTLVAQEPRDPLVQLLIHWRSAFPLAEDLATHLGREVEEVWEAFLDLERAGAVETWPDHPDGPAVMLSSLTAGALGLTLSSDGTRWLRTWQADPTSIDPDLRVWTESDFRDPDDGGPPLFETLADPDAPEGYRAAEAGDAAETRCLEILERWTDGSQPQPWVVDRELSIDDRWLAANHTRPVLPLPPPRVLLGQSLPWPVLVPGTKRPWHRGDGPCPGCRERSLPVVYFCLVCQRSGVDDLIRYLLSLEQAGPDLVARPVKVPRRRFVPASRKPGLRGGLGL